MFILGPHHEHGHGHHEEGEERGTFMMDAMHQHHHEHHDHDDHHLDDVMGHMDDDDHDHLMGHMDDDHDHLMDDHHFDDESHIDIVSIEVSIFDTVEIFILILSKICRISTTIVMDKSIFTNYF